MAKYDIFAALETHPIPLEFNNKLTTSEWLSYLQSIINDVANSNEEFQSTIEKDLGTTISQAVVDIKNYFKSTQFQNENKLNTEEYIKNNLVTLIGGVLEYIRFSLDDKGYFIADIPEVWEAVQFDTVVDSNSEEYGKLILKY